MPKRLVKVLSAERFKNLINEILEESTDSEDSREFYFENRRDIESLEKTFLSNSDSDSGMEGLE